MRTLAFFLLIMVLLIGMPVVAQSPTPTDTDTPVPTVTDTPTDIATGIATDVATATSTPNLYVVSTLPSGQATAVVYTISGGEAAIFGELLVVIGLITFGLYLQAKGRSS